MLRLLQVLVPIGVAMRYEHQSQGLSIRSLWLSSCMVNLAYLWHDLRPQKPICSITDLVGLLAGRNVGLT
jgi:hypothetical protein